MSLQKVFSLILVVASLIGIIGSAQLPLVAPGNLDLGFAPFFYSIGLLICAVLLFIADKSKEKVDFRLLLKEDAGKALVFFLLIIFLLVLLYLFGVIPAMLIFSVLACVALKRLAWRSVLLFSVAWVVVLYVVFLMVLKMPFDRGIIFEMLGYV